MDTITNSEDVDELNKIVTIQSESSFLQQASLKIQEIVKNRSSSILEFLPANKDDNPKQDCQNSESSILKAKLQEQVRTGEITPFQAVEKETKSEKVVGKTLKESTQLLDLEKYIWEQAKLAKQKKLLKQNKKKSSINIKDEKENPSNKRKLEDSNTLEIKSKRAKKLEKVDINESENIINPSDRLTSFESNKAKNQTCDVEIADDSESEYVPSVASDINEDIPRKSKHRKKINVSKPQNCRTRRVLDDGDEELYRERVEECGLSQNEALHKVENLFKVPQRIWKHLFKYQKVAVKWLWELHTRNLGGLLGDEMGLGKTVQVIAFLAGLDCSDLLSDGGRFRGLGPTLIVCPATLLEQWVKHFHDWWPIFRVVILHHSGTFQGSLNELLHTLKGGGILITSYTSVVIHQELLTKFKWQYIILDEGHKIRNPDAKVSKVVKQFLTPHRLLLTGSPMQNSLKELWSLFDFILPGKLGTLPVFMEHCAGPITRGGYSNASRLQETTALQVATLLKNAITPYMLRRTKCDVQHHVNLPEKNEQVLFCSLTEEQRALYKQFLGSDNVSTIVHDRRESGRYRGRLLVALTALRKICNHPDLYLYDEGQNVYDDGEEESEIEIDEKDLDKFGHWKRSGKMTVVRSLLKIWKKQGHRALLFTQSRQMMHVLEGLIQKEKYKYLRMDGTTPMGQRQTTISKFNNDSSYFIFLLTTRVGGLGVNLTGANRVIIYDPDWNPATDAQARERSWRIGQDKNVTVYRLITAGTIEEKMYHRQIFKILLSNRVLEDPRQRRLFRTTDLSELFNLNEPLNGDKSESDQLFRSSKVLPNQPNFSPNKIAAMKKLAAELSKKIGEKASIKSKNEDDDNKKKTNKKKSKTDVKSSSSKLTKEADCTNVNSELQNSSEIEVENKKLKTNEIVTSKRSCESSDVEHDKIKKNRSKKSHRKHKKHKKNKSNEVSALFEGQRVSCLFGRRLENTIEPEPASDADDHYVLSKLFSKSAVCSAFQHESVLSSAVLNPDDETPLQRAAKKEAHEKMDYIRQSRKWCWRPCWDKPPEDECSDYQESDNE